jgi:branched-chain amino acid transport system ATP-binding protein
MSLLELRNVTKNFGKFTALWDVGLSVKEKELLAIIGPNGAGKSTLFNVITGKLAPSSGNIYFQGEQIDGLSTHEIVRKGINKSFQVVTLFPDMTVFSNVRLGVLTCQRKEMQLFKSVDLETSVTKEVEGILASVHLSHRAHTVAHALSHGDQKSLEIGMALSTRPKLLLLDEPTAGMSPEEVNYIVQLIRNIWEKTGVTVMFTEHDLKMVFSISRRIVVLQAGQVIADGTPEEIRQNARVQEAYVGGAV